MGKEPVRGVLYFRRNGRASIHIDGRSEPVPLAKGASGTALHGDEVELRRLSPKKTKSKQKKRFGRKPSKPRYEVVKIHKRGTDEFLGYLQKDGKKRIIRAENSRFFSPFKIVGEECGAKVGDKLLAKFHRWDSPAPSRTAKPESNLRLMLL